MAAKDHAADARWAVGELLLTYKDARAHLHEDIRHAAELGMTTTEIAKLSGMSWHGVAKVLDREAGRHV